MSKKRPSELNVVDRIFYDIKLHGVKSVLNNKTFYDNYKPSISEKDIDKEDIKSLNNEPSWGELNGY